MKKLKYIARTGLLYGLAVLVAGGYPITAMAQAAPAESSVVTPAEEAPVVEEPETTYAYDPETNRWDSNKWKYDAASGQYVSNQGPRTPPPTAPVIDTPSPEQELNTTAIGDVNDTQAPTVSSDTTINTEAGVENELISTTQSGNAGISSNTNAGNAASGDALAAATIVNTVHSSIQGDTAGVAHFVSDIHGNVSGDITLYPALQNAMSSSSGQPNSSTAQINTTAGLTNNISLSAASGNADITNNTNAGSATTGSAHTVANVINLINSIIAANKSFIGTINIYGNLDGDILVSPDFIPQLLASNAPDPTTGPLSVNLSDTQSIVNTVSLDAMAGSAGVMHNTSAGSAKTGSAATNLTILNLSGRQVVASNSLLVFVNVLGKWVGIIVDAPQGATAAALGNGVTGSSGGSPSQTLTADTTSQITNNLTLASQSGNATVAGNTTAGNATSGNATASANIVNISTSTFSLSDWFGILFINVFGSWYGSFGINTANGDVIPVSGMALPPGNFPAVIPHFGFVSTPLAEKPFVPTAAVADSPAAFQEEEAEPTAVLAAASHQEGPLEMANSEPRLNPAFAIMMIAGFLGAIATAVVGLIRRHAALV